MKREDLLHHIKSFPDKPGVYMMRDPDGKIIYVGKAKSLRKRVSSYFRHSGFASPRLRKLVESISDISTIRTETEIEALILENRLIKLYQPFFNIDLKMNERYAYIKVTSEKFPRIVVTRHRQEDDAVYIGPFVRVSEVRELLRLIERYLPLRYCKGEIKESNKKIRPCMRHALGHCLAPCAGLCSEKEYRERTADVIMMLQGRGLELVEKLRKRMDKAVQELEFEEAAVLRDTIRAIWRVSRQRNSIPEIETGRDNNWETLNRLQEHLKLPTLPWRIDGFDISHTSGKETVGVVVVFEQGYPNTSLYRRFNIRTVVGIDDFRSIKETLLRRYRRCIDGQEPMPQLILIDGGSVQLEFAMEAMKELELTDIPIISLAKEEEEIYIPDRKEPLRLDRTDPALKLLQYVRDESHRYAITSHRAARSRNFRRSKLEEVPGVGRTKAAQLITKFGSTRAIMDTAEENLASAPGIGKTLARRIQEYLRQADEGSGQK
ncbi:MAG TPA: excinuclease ABC subunit C [Synergistaceae bacterium]|uniref:excinuclease ABC subunit UvrC n=1 Tax=Synergistaceae TaxID=649777 RepID=UPI000EDFF32E|nr:excinuclease ABC subunit UvrC [Synergistaceae bacterium DZ-S4]HAH70051.1 excinuclease ABC subunit C [Synergistaceae bacterium]